MRLPDFYIFCLLPLQLVPAPIQPYNPHMEMRSDQLIIIRGGGDLASGTAWRLYHAGLRLLITEQPKPLAVRRMVSFCEAVYRGAITVEGVTARRAETIAQAQTILAAGEIPVVVDPTLSVVGTPTADSRNRTSGIWSSSSSRPASDGLRPLVIVDARMTKLPPEPGAMNLAPFVIGLGPGFVAGENCHAVIETNRGHFLGRVIWDGPPQPDTGIPGAVRRHQSDRVLRAPADGILKTRVELGERLHKGQVIAEVAGQPVTAAFDGILRGLLHDGLRVTRGLKIGDLDPRLDPRYARTISEKSLAIGGGVLEALLTRPEIRARLWN
jgi:xanthine dehydrogenase accessory factor